MDAPAAAAAQAGSKDDADFDREDDVKVASSLMKGAAGPPQHLCVFTASNYFLSRHYLFVLLLLPLPLSSWRVFARSWAGGLCASPELANSSTQPVVGCRYYSGVVHRGEFAFLVREPHNPYDANAIAVKNLLDHQVGHINREAAACLAPILDDDRPIAPHVEAEVLGSNSGTCVHVQVNFYAPEALRSRTVKRLKRHGVVLETERALPHGDGESSTGKGAVGGGVVSKVDGSAMHANSQKALQDLFDRLSGQPQLDVAGSRASLAGKLNAVLLPHQEEGVAWLQKMETTNERLPFWKEIEGARVCSCLCARRILQG